MGKQISEEIKAQVIKRVRNDGEDVQKLAGEFGLNSRTIYAWLSKTVTEGSGLILEVGRLKKENKLLLELVGKLMLEKAKTPLKKN
jgi:transposase-like protein